jgi:sugar O-acyltransferase (sialic acid O-acetyltransferase NeuD family)
MDKLVIFGFGELAELAYEYLKKKYYISAFATSSPKYPPLYKELPVLEMDKLPANSNVFVAIGYSRINKMRNFIGEYLEAAGHNLIGYVDDRAVIADTAQIQMKNTFIMELNNIQHYAKIGKSVIMWAGNHIGHHSVIEDNVFIASHAVISGSCKIGKNSFIGINASIIDGVRVADHNIIGAGAIITKDTLPYKVYIGVDKILKDVER